LVIVGRTWIALEDYSVYWTRITSEGLRVGLCHSRKGEKDSFENEIDVTNEAAYRAGGGTDEVYLSCEKATLKRQIDFTSSGASAQEGDKSHI